MHIKSQVSNILQQFIKAQASNKCFYAKERYRNQEASKLKLVKYSY